jgi:molecular chaperone HtpG
MPPISLPPKTIYDCGLLKSLESKSTNEDGAYSLAKTFIGTVTPLLDSIAAGPFGHYTLHNRDHAKKLLHLTDSILSTKTIERLSIVEHLVIIYAAHLHDLGLYLAPEERQKVLQSEPFLASLRSWPELHASLEESRKRLQTAQGEDEKLLMEGHIFELQEAALSNYLRPLHATSAKYRELMLVLMKSSGRDDLFSFAGTSFADWLVDVCVSHNLSANILAESMGPFDERFPRDALVAGNRLNTQFCSVVLRLSDVMDFDQERTPRILFESLGISYRDLPGSDITLREWQKHMAVHTVSLDSDEIVVAADCHHPVIEKTIRDFCQIIEREIRDSLAVLRRNAPETVNQYFIDLPISVRPKIRSIGYVFRDMSLQLNQAAIATLLMGERLYSSRAAAVRELLQNAIDACSALEQIEGHKIAGSIAISDSVDENGRHWIEVSDNGIGMDEHVLSEYFLKLGNSYYDSPEFRRLTNSSGEADKNAFVPIARFGVGIASVFMLADLLEVKTRTVHSLFNDTLSRTVRIERMGSLAFVTESHDGRLGTRVSLRLKRDLNDRYAGLASSILTYLRQVVLRPKYDLEISLGEQKLSLPSNRKLELKPDAQDYLKKRELEIFIVDLQQHSKRMSGEVVMFFHADADGTLSNRDQNNAMLVFGRNGLDPVRVFKNYTGNRIAIDGFRMSLKKMSKLLSIGKNRIPLILDLNISGDREIQYDVARDRIIAQGKFHVAIEFRESLLRALTQSNMLERLRPDTRKLVEDLIQIPAAEYVRARGYMDFDEREIARIIEDLIPDRVWTPELVGRIAPRLKIPPEIVNRILRQLLEQGLLSRPGAI